MMNSPHAPQPTMHLLALCRDCQRFHEEDSPLHGLLARMSDWNQKHTGHDIEIISRKRAIPRGLDDRLFQEYNYTPWWLTYRPNADFKLAYGASAAYTITLASLATSAPLLVGQESTAISNTANLYLDYLIAGRIMVGTTPTTATTIEVWVYASENDTPIYPDTITGANSARTMLSAGIKQSGLTNIAVLNVDSATSNRPYPFRAVSLELSIGRVPKFHGLFVTHNTAVALHATAGNHILSYTPVYTTG